MAGGTSITAGQNPAKQSPSLVADPAMLEFLKQSGLDANLIADIEAGAAAVLQQMNQQISVEGGTQTIANNNQIQKQGAKKRDQDAAAAQAIANSTRRAIESSNQAQSQPGRKTGNLFQL